MENPTVQLRLGWKQGSRSFDEILGEINDQVGVSMEYDGHGIVPHEDTYEVGTYLAGAAERLGQHDRINGNGRFRFDVHTGPDVAGAGSAVLGLSFGGVYSPGPNSWLVEFDDSVHRTLERIHEEIAGELPIFESASFYAQVSL